MPADPSCQTSGMKTQIEFQLLGMGIWIHLKIGYNWLHFLHKDLLQNKIAILEHSHFWTNPYTMLLLGFPRHLDTHTHTWQKWELMASYPLLCLRPHSGSMDLFMVFVHWSIKLLQPELELDDLGLTISPHGSKPIGVEINLCFTPQFPISYFSTRGSGQIDIPKACSFLLIYVYIYVPVLAGTALWKLQSQ